MVRRDTYHGVVSSGSSNIDCIIATWLEHQMRTKDEDCHCIDFGMPMVTNYTETPSTSVECTMNPEPEPDPGETPENTKEDITKIIMHNEQFVGVEGIGFSSNGSATMTITKDVNNNEINREWKSGSFKNNSHILTGLVSNPQRKYTLITFNSIFQFNNKITTEQMTLAIKKENIIEGNTQVFGNILLAAQYDVDLY